MKKIILIALAILCNLNIVSQTTQPGHVVEYKGKTPKTPLKRAIQINVKGMQSAENGDYKSALNYWNIILKDLPDYLKDTQEKDGYTPELYTILKEKGLVK